MRIVKASRAEIVQVSALFDGYRQFYEQAPDLDAATTFIEARLEHQDSVIFLALADDGEPLGFVQLYPSFSSVAMKSMWYLNDLFVADSARGQGVARALLKHVESFAKETGALTVKLATAVSNVKAKALYESEGYVKVTTFDHYTQRVKSA
ncbi:GNAT family N-acetyltransferase [Photobacterium sp. MCCC 1A19761]|uniref:GNAT family N-acetyltransferase n=1 Tax=Photobacterium sp. MCCC 1A19761 TaxID=3115000 RepID=UPI00307EDEB8